eukprot:scaffold2513_cov18-Tisochrysis_lutea.AAC.3
MMPAVFPLFWGARASAITFALRCESKRTGGGMRLGLGACMTLFFVWLQRSTRGHTLRAVN